MYGCGNVRRRCDYIKRKISQRIGNKLQPSRGLEDGAYARGPQKLRMPLLHNRKQRKLVVHGTAKCVKAVIEKIKSSRIEVPQRHTLAPPKPYLGVDERLHYLGELDKVPKHPTKCWESLIFASTEALGFATSKVPAEARGGMS